MLKSLVTKMLQGFLCNTSEEMEIFQSMTSKAIKSIIYIS